jgi:hypothetical protein
MQRGVGGKKGKKDAYAKIYANQGGGKYYAGWSEREEKKLNMVGPEYGVLNNQ